MGTFLTMSAIRTHALFVLIALALAGSAAQTSKRVSDPSSDDTSSTSSSEADPTQIPAPAGEEGTMADWLARFRGEVPSHTTQPAETEADKIDWGRLIDIAESEKQVLELSDTHLKEIAETLDNDNGDFESDHLTPREYFDDHLSHRKPK